MARRKKPLKFPREFRKKPRQSFDRDFLLILLLCLFFHFGLIGYLLRHLPMELPLKSIAKIQAQFATTFLNRTQGTIEMSAANLMRKGGEGMISGAGGGAAEGGMAGGGRSGRGAGSEGFGADYGGREAGLPTVGELAARRGGRGGRSIDAMADEMGAVGLLGVLTSGSGYVPGDYIEGITNYGDAENARLGTVLSSLDALSISRGRGGKGFGAGGGDGTGGGDGEGSGAAKALRGGGRKVRAIDVEDLLTNVQGTGKVEFKDIDRTQQSFVQISKNIPPKPPVPVTAEEKASLRRKPEHVQAVIDRHRMAITDCYKNLLKNDPFLKGKVEVRLAIDPEGKVSWVEVVSSTFNDKSFEECIMAKIKNWNDFGYADPTAPDEVYRQVYTFGY